MITYVKDLFARLFTVHELTPIQHEVPNDTATADNEPLLGDAQPQTVLAQPAQTVPVVPVLTVVVPQSENSKYGIQRVSDSFYMGIRRLPCSTYAWEGHKHEAMEFKSLDDCEKIRSITPDKTRRVVL